jgi:protein-L-isoaspartate(D-aspartate) O-methyltransferase
MTLAERRRLFAEEIEAVAHLDSPRLVDAFARVPRELFLGPGPWQIDLLSLVNLERPYRTTVDDDPKWIYHDVIVAIDPARRLNNGQPSALARWIDPLAIASGAEVMHLGCGVGYYTAILAELAGPDGRVYACDVDPEFAARARQRLTAWPTVTVEANDGSSPPGSYDAILINAGVTHPRPEWLAALKPGGRLVLPLTVHVPGMGTSHGVGAMMCATRGNGHWPARFISPVGIYDCVNARDPANEAKLMAATNPQVAAQLRRVSVEPHAPGPKCGVHLDGFCLQA